MANLYLISNLKTRIDATLDEPRAQIAALLKLPESEIESVNLVKQSLDARKKPVLFHVCQVEVRLRNPLPRLPPQLQIIKRSRLAIEPPDFLNKGASSKRPIVIVGTGPAGLFAALALAEAGLPVLVLERGKPVETRMRDIGQLRSHGHLDPESNVCYGEGGAGAYTDGKLYTRVKTSLRAVG